MEGYFSDATPTLRAIYPQSKFMGIDSSIFEGLRKCFASFFLAFHTRSNPFTEIVGKFFAT